MSRKKIFVIVGLITGLLLAAFIVSRIGSGGLEYSPKGKNSKGGPIVIKATDSVDSAHGEFSIYPAVEGDLQIVDNFIIFWPQEGAGFEESVRYNASFKNYKMAGGTQIKDLEISFDIDRYTDYSELQKEVLSKYGRFEVAVNPFLSKLPYTEPYKFKVSFVINEHEGSEDMRIQELLGDEQNWREKKNNYTVIIETLVVQGNRQSYQSFVREVKKARAAALAWISQQGVDTKKDIVYQFVPNDRTLKNPEAEYEEVLID
jgi:hypothetical protein